MTDATQIVDAACANKDTIIQVLAWAGATMPVASAITWGTAKWGKLPPGLQSILQLFAGNFIHAVMGEPVKPPVP